MEGMAYMERVFHLKKAGHLRRAGFFSKISRLALIPYENIFCFLCERSPDRGLIVKSNMAHPSFLFTNTSASLYSLFTSDMNPFGSAKLYQGWKLWQKTLPNDGEVSLEVVELSSWIDIALAV